MVTRAGKRGQIPLLALIAFVVGLVALAVVLTPGLVESFFRTLPDSSNPGVAVVNTPTTAATATNTLEPTATLAPTVITAYVISPELPFDWVEPLYLAVKSYEPLASITVAACITEEYKSYGQCVTAVDFCPQGECSAALVLYDADSLAKAPQQVLDTIYAAKEAALGDEYYVILNAGQSVPKSFGLFPTWEEWSVFECMLGYPPVSYDEWLQLKGSWDSTPRAYWPISQEVAAELHDGLGLANGIGLEHSSTECQR